MNKTLAIIGAGDLGQHIAHYAKISMQYSSIVFFDDTKEIGAQTQHGNVIGDLSSIDQHIQKQRIQHLLIGIGYKHMLLRQSLYDKYAQLIVFPNIIHSSCYIDISVKIGSGNMLLPGCVIDKGCVIENNTFFNPKCTIAHDNHIDSHTFFGPGVTTSGYVHIGQKCFIGTSSTIIDNIAISDNTQIGAGSVVAKNIISPGLYIGVPAKIKS